jgi:Transcriptional regulators
MSGTKAKRGATPIVRYTRRGKKSLSAEEVLHDHMAAVTVNIQKTMAVLRTEAFSRALDLLCDEKRHLYLLGTSLAMHLLGYFSVLTRYMRSNFTLLTGDTANIAHQTATISEDAVLFALSYKRYANVTQTVMQHFHESGHEVIFLTDSYSAPGLQYASVPMVVDTGGHNMFNTRCSAIAVLEALINGMSVRYENTVPERYDAIGTMLRRLNVYSM